MVSDNPMQQVRESSKWVEQHSKDVKINHDKIIEFLDNIKEDEFKQKSSIVLFPLNFSNNSQEANFWFILDLLNFGSGFRKELKEASGKGAYETLCYGLMGMFLSQGGKLSAHFLHNLSLNDIGSFFSIPIQEEVQIQTGIYTLKDTTLKPLAVHIQKVLRESTETMFELGYEDFGEFVWKITTPAAGGDTKPLAADFINKIIQKIPAFNDQTVYQDHHVYFFKKVQLLAADLYRRFGESLPERFNFSDIDQLTVFTDNVLPAVLRKFGILELSPSLAAHIDSSKELESGDQETELRILAIQACNEMMEIVKTRPQNSFIKNSLELDYYLWTKGKDKEFREAERHYTKKTIFY
ncbi:hypothetical protein CYY_007147 [Polysphondylium violaceum]|uniref:Queuosine 5'-phosphate N-glycosylase/hydrolase n=1 Tax=Polysphondylium violaceum TaxID=133409 RepID=A0A8J4UY76_9MYCE|nr:hypothetical protein CYY_007147 [Polysphondylium violaceum]